MITWKTYNENVNLVSGMVLRLDKDHENEILLVGDVNSNLGFCECCSVYKNTIAEYSLDLISTINSHIR